jgi:hypothetical protein
MLAMTDPTIFDTVNAFADAAEGFADLRLVRAVDDTVDSLCVLAKIYRAHAVTGRALVSQIKEAPVLAGTFMDPEARLEEALDEMISRSEAYLSTLTAKKDCIDRDSALTSAHCDMLHTSYDDALVALAQLIEVAKDMRAAVISHDLAAEVRDGAVYESPQALRAALLH